MHRRRRCSWMGQHALLPQSRDRFCSDRALLLPPMQREGIDRDGEQACHGGPQLWQRKSEDGEGGRGAKNWQHDRRRQQSVLTAQAPG